MFSVILHEYGHILMAQRLDYKTGDIILFPFGGLAAIDTVAMRGRHEALIALAGPAVNLIIALVFLVLLVLSWSLPVFGISDIVMENLLLPVLVVNLVIMAFNLLPLFPMDGGRVLRGFLAELTGHCPATIFTVLVTWMGSILLIGFILGHGFVSGLKFTSAHDVMSLMICAIIMLIAAVELHGVWHNKKGSN